ncbi:hypothetical protein MRB56_12545 [Halomonas cupida]|uniref:hypothetical protein n=2 Tax=Halomonas cupida TaxID=44933 RepID=UPI0039B3EA7D
MASGLVINPACFHVGLMAAQGSAAVGHQADARPRHTSRSAHLCQCGADDNQIDQDALFDCHVINPACFHVGLMAAQGSAAVGHQADARPRHTSRSAHLCQCGADDNQIDQDELFDCHVNSSVSPAFRSLGPGCWPSFHDRVFMTPLASSNTLPRRKSRGLCLVSIQTAN